MKKSLNFKDDLVSVQNDLLRFAVKLTSNREEADDLLQETSLKALDNEDKFTPDTNFNPNRSLVFNFLMTAIRK